MAEQDVSVALSGSGFRLATHIGALQAVLDKGYVIKEIAGTSGGSIVASLYALGFSPAKLYELMLETSLGEFLDWNIGLIIGRKAISDGNNLLNWLETQIGPTTTFADSLIPLTVISTDLNKYGTFVFSKDKTPTDYIARACRASCSIPIVFAPVIVGSSFLVDGGVCDDLPVNYLTAGSLKIAVELFESSAPLDENYDIFSLLGRVLDTIINVENDDQLENVQNCLPIKITTPPGLSLDTKLTPEQKKQLYDLGYEATSVILSKL